VRVATALAIPELLRSLGADPVKVLGELGYDARLFDDPENRLPLAAHNRIVGHCATRTGCTHFGLLVGQADGLHSFGLVGLLVKHSPDVETAIRSFVRYLYLHVQGAAVDLRVQDDAATLTWHLNQPGLEAVDHIGDGALAVLYNVMHELCGPDWRPTEVWFARQRPEDLGPYRRFFRVPMRFNAEQYALHFSAAFLKRRLPGIDAELRRLLEAQISALEARHREDFPAQVRSLLQATIGTGRCNADQIAALFGMHSRTMNRRLNHYGVGFQQLLEETRFEIARQMLEFTTVEIGKIADLLGYAAPGIFTRAFRRWSNTTPAEWRAERRRTG
jgi:AraC-like DNA-binding protein